MEVKLSSQPLGNNERQKNGPKCKMLCVNIRCTKSRYMLYDISGEIQGVQEKCVFHNSLQPLPSGLSTQCECTVTPIGWYFFVQPIAAECWRGRGGKLSRVLGKNTIFNEHPVLHTHLQTAILTNRRQNGRTHIVVFK